MNVLVLVLLVLALVAFLVSAVSARRPDRWPVLAGIAVGLALWGLVLLLRQLGVAS